MKYQTVIIRYNEDIEWANHLKHPAIIYNKGDDIISKHPVVNLKNIGMFVASQLYHCIDNYDNLADKTFFVQGHPWDGCFEQYNNISNNKNDVRDFEYFYFDGDPLQHASLNYFLQTLGENANIQPPNYNQRHHDCFIKYTHTWKEWLKEIDPYNKIDLNAPIRFYRNGHITLSKESIRSNPIEWYLKILNYLRYDVPCIEWYTESTHNFIFNINNDGQLEDYGHQAPDYKDKKLDYSFWKK
jgi:hypothetical protein